MSVKLDYGFFPELPLAAPFGEAQLQNPPFGMLAAIREQGSIGKAADRLGLSYRYLWGVLKKHEGAFGQPLLAGGQGQAARLSEFGERLLWAEKKMLARLLPQADSLAGQIDRDLLLAVDPALQILAASASHDPLLGALRDRLRRHAKVLLDLEYVGSEQALERLNRGDCQLAGIHLPLPDDALCRRGGPIHQAVGRQLRLGEHKLIRLVVREQGLMCANGNPKGIDRLGDLERPDVRFINRPAESATRHLFDELLARGEIASQTVAGYRRSEPTHLAVAAAIAAGDADCGFGLRTAAVRFGLDFVPLIKEQYFLVCRKPALDTPALQALCEVLGSENFRRLAGSLPGYAAEGAGEIVSLRRTLAWYK
jgi:putative molybdopterin biosynthesis protein